MSTLPLKCHSTNALRSTKDLPNHKNGQRRIVSLHDFSSQKSRRSSAFSNEKLKNGSWGKNEDYTKRDNLSLRSHTMSPGHVSRPASSNEIRFGIDSSSSLRRRDTSIQDNLDDMQPAFDDAQPPATEKSWRNKHELPRPTLVLDTEEIKLALQKIQKENPFNYIALHKTNTKKDQPWVLKDQLQTWQYHKKSSNRIIDYPLYVNDWE